MSWWSIYPPMTSPGKLRLLSKLNDSSIEQFEPTINDKGQVNYTDVEDLLTSRDGSSVEVLSSLAKKKLLEEEYTTKVYICPSCQIEGMQYITSCQFCESTHAIRTTFFEHKACYYTAVSQEFKTEDSTDTYHCPDCNEELDSSDINIYQQYICKECGESFENPRHRLLCLNCRNRCPPEKATEQTLYTYTLTEDGKDWYELQTRARELLADELASRAFDVYIDTAVQNEENEQYPVHIHAEDEFLNQQVVADVHSTVNSDDLDYISNVAREIQARPLLLATNDSLSTDLLRVATQYGITMLWVDRDDSIKRYDAIEGGHHSGANILDRLSSAIGLTSREK